MLGHQFYVGNYFTFYIDKKQIIFPWLQTSFTSMFLFGK